MTLCSYGAKVTLQIERFEPITKALFCPQRYRRFLFWQRVHKWSQLYLLIIRHCLTLIPNSLAAFVWLRPLESLRKQRFRGVSVIGFWSWSRLWTCDHGFRKILYNLCGESRVGNHWGCKLFITPSHYLQKLTNGCFKIWIKNGRASELPWIWHQLKPKSSLRTVTKQEDQQRMWFGNLFADCLSVTK